MEHVKIIGIVLVRNEEVFIHHVLSNIAEFCDEIIVADNKSKDKTAEIVQQFSRNYKRGKIRYHSVAHPRESHRLIESFANSKTWIFAVDGDELYDPAGLAEFRNRLVSGDFDDYWALFGNVLNCVDLNIEKRYAQGYLAPPCRSMTKLYNFSVIESWSGECPERLHGGTVVFKEGYSRSLRNEMYKEVDWEDSDFRCLHLCFLRRSTHDKVKNAELVIRKNISDGNAIRLHERLWDGFTRLLGKDRSGKVSVWKQEKYMRGRLVKKDISPFLIPELNESI